MWSDPGDVFFSIASIGLIYKFDADTLAFIVVDFAFASDANAWKGECEKAKFAEEDATEEASFFWF